MPSVRMPDRSVPVLMLLAFACGRLLGQDISSTLSPDQARILQGVRERAVAYSEKLPDFICTQLTHREVSRLGDTEFATGSSRSEIEQRLTFMGTRRTTRLSR